MEPTSDCKQNTNRNELLVFILIVAAIVLPHVNGYSQNVGINTTTPQATLDVRGNQRVGGSSQFLSYDSLSGKVEWRNSYLYMPVSQFLFKHSAAADGLYYNNSGGISGQLEYRNAIGNPVFYTNFTNGNGYFSNRLGIGNLSPQFPLSFNGSIGDKISLWTDGTPTHYGLGIQPGLLQLFSKTLVDDIAFGYGSSTSFAERMRIKNQGEFGMELNGRLLLKNGTIPIDNNYGPGIWLTKADNSSLIGFIGTQNNQNMGFYGGPAGWGFTYDAINSRVGIGNTAPNAPLSFPPSLGKKITLYPGTTGDVGIAVQGNLLQIYSDNPSADIALGYDQGGVFTERFRVKANGSLAINGNSGQPGQLLRSNGTASSPNWVTPVTYFESSGASFAPLINNGEETTISSVSVTVTQPSLVEVFGELGIQVQSCFGCGDASVYLLMNDPSQSIERVVAANPHASSITVLSFRHQTIFPLPPGNYVFTLRAKKINGPTVGSSSGYTNPYDSPFGRLLAKVIPQ